MKEILAENLQTLFNNSELRGKCTYHGKEYEVWEVSDEDFETMCNMSDEEFEKLCPDGMWRYAKGSNMEIPDTEYKINGLKIIAWDGEHRKCFYEDNCKDCGDRLNQMCEGAESDIEICHGKREYNTLLDYFHEEISVGQPRNVCALAVDLAKYNNMTLSELFGKYEE
jgi:hypothetical protein